MTRMNIKRQVEAAILRYIRARQNLIRQGQKYPELIGGNDNIIGRIGEYYAITFLSEIGQKPIKESNSSKKGFDLKDAKTKLITQVKVITAENKRGRTVRLTEPWDQLVLIKLDEEYEPITVGMIDKAQFNNANRQNRGWSKNPIIKKTMLGPKGLIGKYGRIEPT